jgi:phosphohistidine phosphatase
MNLYLMQHGLATSAEENPDRPLTDVGRGEIEAIAAWLDDAGVRVSAIKHSGKTRARQSAEALSRLGTPGCLPEVHPGLAPKDPIDPVAAWIASLTDDTLVVGHLPLLGLLAARLLVAREEIPLLAFEPGAIAGLTGSGADWSVSWMLRPQLVRRD